jgi:hypothetical protein
MMPGIDDLMCLADQLFSIIAGNLAELIVYVIYNAPGVGLSHICGLVECKLLLSKALKYFIS